MTKVINIRMLIAYFVGILSCLLVMKRGEGNRNLYLAIFGSGNSWQLIAGDTFSLGASFSFLSFFLFSFFSFSEIV